MGPKGDRGAVHVLGYDWKPQICSRTLKALNLKRSKHIGH